MMTEDGRAIHLRMVMLKEGGGYQEDRVYIYIVEDDPQNDYQLSLFWGSWDAYLRDPKNLSYLRTNRDIPRHHGQDLWELKRQAYILAEVKGRREGYRVIAEVDVAWLPRMTPEVRRFLGPESNKPYHRIDV